MPLDYKKIKSAIVMSDTKAVLPSLFLSIDNPNLMLSSIEDMFFDSGFIVFCFPDENYAMSEDGVVMGGREKFAEFVDYLKTEGDFVISLCDSDFSVKSSFVANYSK